MNLSLITNIFLLEYKNKMFGYQRPWHANSIHCFQGRLFIGSKVAIVSNIFNLLLLIYAGSLLFYCFALLWNNGFRFILIVALLLYLIFTVNLFLAAYTDPGVLLRPKEYLSLKQADHIKKEKVIKDYLAELQEKSRLERIDIETQMRNDGATDEQIQLRLKRFDNLVKVNWTYEVSARKYKFDQLEKIRKEMISKEITQPHIFTTRYCNTCLIWKPSGVSHCMHWNHWVRGFDHHWSVFNGCVGERNIRNFIYLLFSSSILSFIFTYLIYSYYSYWIYNIIDKQHFDLLIEKKTMLVILIIFGVFSVIISYLGFWIWGWVGIIGIIKLFIDMNQILEGVQNFTINLYPLTSIFTVPIFYLLIFQFLNYLRMIYCGVNQKVEASILKFNKSAPNKYKIAPPLSIGIMRLINFFFLREVSPSELRREMTVDAKLEYENPPDDL